MNTSNAWKPLLDTRYPTTVADTACGIFTLAFGNVWNNYYFIKIPKLKDISGRWTTANTDVNTIKTKLGVLQTTMTQVLGNLTNTVDSITNAKYGLIAGLNCRLIGEDIMLLVNSICVSNFNTIYITRMAMGIIAFGILISLCCIVCSGVRHFKHSERKDKIAPSFVNSKNSFEDTDAAFKP